MPIDEVIEVLTKPVYRIGMVPDRDFIKALRIGIEALKRIDELRRFPDHNPKWLLPGETDTTVNKVDWGGSRDYIGKVGGET